MCPQAYLPPHTSPNFHCHCEPTCRRGNLFDLCSHRQFENKEAVTRLFILSYLRFFENYFSRSFSAASTTSGRAGTLVTRAPVAL